MERESQDELMAAKAVDAFMDRWMNDPDFAQSLRGDPEAALRSCGIDAQQPMVEFFRQMDREGTVEELRARVSKALTAN